MKGKNNKGKGNRERQTTKEDTREKKICYEWTQGERRKYRKYEKRRQETEKVLNEKMYERKEKENR